MLKSLLISLAFLCTAEDEITAIRGGTILTITKGTIENGVIIIKNGKIEQVGKEGEVKIPDGAKVIDAKSKYIMPGIIDAHSHMGVYPWPHVMENADGNEATDPITPQVRAEDSFFTEDPALKRAVAGGITTILVLPGSANMIGGQGIVLKLRINHTLDEMKFEGSPSQMKMASGENPKMVYGFHKNKFPATRMGNFALLREWFTKAKEYMEKWKRYEEKKAAGKDADPPALDMKLDALARILKGEIFVQIHCYRADEILTLISISKEFGFKIRAIHHALDAYKIAKIVAEEKIAVATFVDWWGFKIEAWDGNPYAPAILSEHGVKVALKSDSSDMVQRMYHEGAKAVKYGMPADEALKSLTLYPAYILGVEDKVGSIEVGKQADLAIFSKHPFDMYTLCEMTFIDGKMVFDRSKNKDYYGDILK